MRIRILKIGVRIGSLEMPLASVKIQSFADVLEPETDLVCPACKAKPKWNGGYDCTCGKRYNHWSQLLRVDHATGEPINKVKFTNEEDDVIASAYIMDQKEFSGVVDATLKDYGVIAMDDTSGRNLRKLLIATKALSKVVLLRFLDTYEERVVILTTSISSRIILKEIIPQNLANVKETMHVDLSNISEQDIIETEQFIKQLPAATPNLLEVSDYRTKGIHPPQEIPKVIELEAILSKAGPAHP
jgi:hypothetical protein